MCCLVILCEFACVQRDAPDPTHLCRSSAVPEGTRRPVLQLGCRRSAERPRRPSQNYLQTLPAPCPPQENTSKRVRVSVHVHARSRAHVRGGWGPCAWARGSGRRTSHCRTCPRSAWQSRGSGRAVVMQQLDTCIKTKLNSSALRCVARECIDPRGRSRAGKTKRVLLSAILVCCFRYVFRFVHVCC